MNTATFYDQYWQGGLHGNPEWSDQWFTRILGPLIGRDRVLDYGCGMGYAYQRPLSRAVKTYVGADVAEVALANAHRHGLATLKINPENGAVDSPEAVFDGATCIEVMEHLFDPLQAAREIHRVMKPGGILIVTVPNFGYHPHRLMALLRAQVPSAPDDPKKNRFNGVHIRFFSKLMLKRLLRDAGFTKIKIGSFDDASVWDIFDAAGYFGYIGKYARKYLPAPLHLRFLQDVWPNVFAKRLRAEAMKPA
jgi:SAM-dependent methyltransferase